MGDEREKRPTESAARRRLVIWSLIGLGCVATIVGISALGRQGKQPASSGSGQDTSSGFLGILTGGRDGWTYESSTDPMSDAKVSRVTRSVEGTNANLDVSVSCADGGALSYSLTVSGSDSEPTELRARVVPFGTTAGTWVDYEARADSQPAQEISFLNPEYSNQVVLGTRDTDAIYDSNGDLTYPSSILTIDPTERLARASKVTLRLPLTDADETFAWRQDDPAFRRAIMPCLDQRSAARAQMTKSWNEELESRKRDYNERVARMNERTSEVAGKKRDDPMIAEYEKLNSDCRGGSGDDPATMEACEQRDAVGKKLDARGVCKGRQGEAGYEMTWHRCDGTSLRLE